MTSKARIVDADRFILRDSAGNVRAEFEAETDAVALTLYDAQGVALGFLRLGREQSDLRIAAGRNEARASLHLSTEGAFFDIISGPGHSGVSVQVSGQGSRVILADSHGVRRVRLTAF